MTYYYYTIRNLFSDLTAKTKWYVNTGTKSLMAAQMIDQLRATQVWLGVDGSPSRERGGGGG